MFFVVCAIPAKSNVSRSMWPSRSSDSRSVCTANMVTELGVGAAGGGVGTERMVTMREKWSSRRSGALDCLLERQAVMSAVQSWWWWLS